MLQCLYVSSPVLAGPIEIPWPEFVKGGVGGLTLVPDNKEVLPALGTNQPCTCAALRNCSQHRISNLTNFGDTILNCAFIGLRGVFVRCFHARN